VVDAAKLGVTGIWTAGEHSYVGAEAHVASNVAVDESY
jgi:hypothetical protein